jgi:hypothetical protein
METIMSKINDTSRNELTIDQLDLVWGGVATPTASVPSTDGPDVTADARKSSGGGTAGKMYLVFQFKLVAV